MQSPSQRAQNRTVPLCVAPRHLNPIAVRIVRETDMCSVVCKAHFCMCARESARTLCAPLFRAPSASVLCETPRRANATVDTLCRMQRFVLLNMHVQDRVDTHRSCVDCYGVSVARCYTHLRMCTCTSRPVNMV